MLNHITVTPRDKRPRATSAVVATVDNDEVLLVDPENAGSALSSDFVPVTGGQEQWTYNDLTSTHYAESKSCCSEAER